MHDLYIIYIIYISRQRNVMWTFHQNKEHMKVMDQQDQNTELQTTSYYLGDISISNEDEILSFYCSRLS